MFEASTPIVNKRVSRLVSESVTPLRRLSVQNNLPTIPDTVDKSDDRVERERRRSQVRIQKRLSNIPSFSSPLNESITAKEANVYAQTCIKLFAENKINAQVAWGLKIIDYLSKLKDSLAVAGTSLHVSASVFGLKVDDTHASGMNLASTIMTTRNKNVPEDDGDEDVDGDENKENEGPEGAKKKKTKKPRRLLAGQNAAVAKERESLLVQITKVDSTFFQTQTKAELCAIDNLFTSRFPRDSTGWRFIFNFDEKQKAWTKPDDPDPIVDDDGTDQGYPFAIPPLKKFKLCPAFADFDLAKWNPDEEDKLLNDTDRSFRHNTEPLCFENGIPVPELDGSIHDIFQNGGDDGGDFEDNLEEEEFATRFQGNVEHVVNFQPYVTNPSESIISTQNGKIVEQIWAGPSHWKCIFVRPSIARCSGRITNTAQTEQQKQRRKKKEKIASTSLDFCVIMETEKTKKVNIMKKKKTTCDPQKTTLPLPFNIDNVCPLLTKPTVIPQKKKTEKEEDCEVRPYNYNNPNDSLYCSQNGEDAPSVNGDNDGDCNNDDMAGNDGQFQENFADNLIQAPDFVPKNYIQYTKQAKRMNMKKLKNAVWTCLTDGKGDPESDEVIPIREQQFSEVYRTLPRNITDKMRKDLSCPLAFAALLHLCNERDLELVGQSNLKDVFIKPIKDKP